MNWGAPQMTPVKTGDCTASRLASADYFDRQFFPLDVKSRYNLLMIAKLSKEQADALNATGEGELEVVDPSTQRTYFVVDADIHRRAMDALRRQQDRDAIAQGIVEMEAGVGMPLNEAFDDIRATLSLRQRQQ
jgi:hypothetical protein